MTRPTPDPLRAAEAVTRPMTVWWTPDCGFLHAATDPLTIPFRCPDGVLPEEMSPTPNPDALRHPDTDTDDDLDDMCPNCITPWACNGPHLVAETPYMRRLLAVRTGGGCLPRLLLAFLAFWALLMLARVVEVIVGWWR